MKTKLLFVIVFCFFVQIVNAQTYGIKGGVNFANLTISEAGMNVSPKSITSFHFGVVADFKLQGDLYLNTGLLYSLKGAKADVEGVTGTEKLHYLEIPVNLAYKFPINETSKFFIQAGPYFGYALSGKDESGGESTDLFNSGSYYKRFDCGLGFGAGVEFGPLVATLGYELGLANIYDYSGAKLKNKVFQISLAYMF